jgi:hypothetical protein
MASAQLTDFGAVGLATHKVVVRCCAVATRLRYEEGGIDVRCLTVAVGAPTNLCSKMVSPETM